jgi:hypothetical protein
MYGIFNCRIVSIATVKNGKIAWNWIEFSSVRFYNATQLKPPRCERLKLSGMLRAEREIGKAGK